MTTLTVGHMNAHNRWPAARTLLRLRPDTAGWSEVQKLQAAMAKLAGYRVVVEPSRQGGGRGTSQEAPVLTRRKYPTLGRLTLQVSEDVPSALRVAPERWLTVHLFEHPLGAIAHFNIHPNAAVMGVDRDVARVQEYAESIRSLDRALTWAKGEGFKRLLTSDINFRDQPRDPAWSPYPMLEAHGLKVHHVSPIDIMAADRSLKLSHLKVLPERLTGTDHPAALATFTAA